MNNPQKSKIPILLVTENLEIGGAEKYTVLVANELYRRGYRVVVLANHGPFRADFLPGIRFVRAFFEHGWLGVLFGVFQIIRLTWQEGIPLVHTQKLESSQAAWLAKFVTGVPVIKTAHGYTPHELTFLTQRINKYSDRVITVVDWLAAELHRCGVEERKLRIVHNGVAPFGEHNTADAKARLRRQLGINLRDRVVVSLSRLERGKNYAALISWFPWVLSEVPQAKLVIVGSGPDKEHLVQETKDLGLYHSVIFVSATTDVRQYLEIADVFCTPSIGRGMAVMEAMAAGLPVVGIEPKGEPRVIVEGETGYLIPAKEGHLYADRITALLSDPKTALRMGQAARRRIEDNFLHTSMVDGIERVYAEVLEGR